MLLRSDSTGVGRGRILNGVSAASRDLTISVSPVNRCTCILRQSLPTPEFAVFRATLNDSLLLSNRRRPGPVAVTNK